VHHTAIVQTALVSPGVVIDAYCVVGPEVVLAPGVRLHAHVVLMGRVEIGEGSEIFPGAVVGKPPARSAALSRTPVRGGAVQLGARSSVGAHAVIAEDVSIGDDSLVGDGASIREHCRIGHRCVVGRSVSLHPDCELGDGSRLLDGTHLATATRIGRDVFVSVGVMMTSDRAVGRLPFDRDRVRGPAIGDRVAIGAAATILPGLLIGDDALVWAGAVVTRDVAAGTEVSGHPARPVAARPPRS
jgi:UDP-3-O-[3-hydroxymyristoyl] glucosamine N-acyltransferase